MEISSLFIYIAKVSACFILMFGFYLLLLAKQKRSALNRLVLILSVVLSLLLPALSFSYTLKEVRDLPGENEQLVGLHETFSATIHEQSNDIVLVEQPVSPLLQSKWSKGSILLCIYLMASALLVVRLIWHIAKFGIGIKKHGRSELVDGHRIWVSDRWNHTFSFFRLIVFTENDFTNPNRDMLLEHELVHVRQFHSFDLLLAELFTMLCWFNPLVYVYRHSLSEVHEYLADGRVVDRGGDSLVYKQLILDCVSSAAVPRVANTFSAKLLKNRFEMITKTNQSRSVLRYTLLLPITMLLLALFSFKVEHKVEYRTIDELNIVKPVAEDAVSEELLTGSSALNNVLSTEPMAKEIVNNQNISQGKLNSYAVKDSSVLYARLDGLLGSEQEALIKMYQKIDSTLLFGAFYLGDNTPFTFMAAVFEKPMPIFELVAQDDGVVHKPISQNVSDSYVQQNYLIKEKGVYKIRVANHGQVNKVLYYISLPKGMEGEVDFGLQARGKTVFLREKGKSSSATINLFTVNKDSEKPEDERVQVNPSDSMLVVSEKQEMKLDIRKGSDWQRFIMSKGKQGEPDFLKISIRYDKMSSVSKDHDFNAKGSNLMRIDDQEVDQILQYLNKNIVYPATYKPKRRVLDGVEVEFILSETAEVSDVKVVKGINPELDAELVRVVSQMPGWKPEKPYGVPIPISVTLGFSLTRK